MLFQEFDHVLIEEPWLLELAGVSGPVQRLQLAAGEELLQLEAAWMGPSSLSEMIEQSPLPTSLTGLLPLL